MTLIRRLKWLIRPNRRITRYGCAIQPDSWSNHVKDRKPQDAFVADLGWTPDRAASVRAQLGSFEEDWLDPEMDVYDEVHNEGDESS
jgi:hypothetical protein